MTDRVRSLDRIRVVSPCTTDWDSMIGNDQVRFCEHCDLKVTDLSTMTRRDAMRLVARSQGRLCVRYVQRPDGGVLTKQIPEKLHRIGRRVSRIAAGAFTATLSLSAAAAQTRSDSSPQTVRDQATIAEVVARPDLGATLSGVITDLNGAVVAGATLTLTNAENHVAFSYTTTDDGAYRFSFLTAGTYHLVAEAPTFARAEISEISLTGNDNQTQSLALQVPQVVAEVEVIPESRVISVLGGAISIAAPEEPLVKAVFENDLATVRALIPSVADINARDTATHLTALDQAVENANLEMVRMLLNAGADATLKGEHGETPLMYLRAGATVEMVRDLLARGVDVNAAEESGSTALLKAASSCSVEVVRELIGQGANMAAKDDDGVTVLMNAAENGDPAVVAMLLKAGVDISAADNAGNTALINAVRWGEAETVKVLIAVHADVDAKDDDGRSVLMFGIENGEPEIVDLLINAGARVNVKDDYGATALMVAAYGGKIVALKALINAGAEVNTRDEDGQTALMRAAGNRELEVVKMLLTAGADLTIKDKDGKTALGLALASANEDLVRLLRARGAPE